MSKVETLEREANDELKAKLRSGSISINKAIKTLQQSTTNKNATTLLDTPSQSADPSSAPNPVDNDTTPHLSEVVPPELQVSVSSQPSDEDVSDNETSSESVLQLITSYLSEFYPDFVPFFSSNDFYCNEEVLKKDWMHSFSALVSTEFSNTFWQKLQQARKNHSLTKVVVLIQLGINIYDSFFNDALLVIANDDCIWS